LIDTKIKILSLSLLKKQVPDSTDFLSVAYIKLNSPGFFLKASVLGANYPRVFHKIAVLKQKARFLGEAAVLYRKSPGFFREALFWPGFLKGRCSGHSKLTSQKPGVFSKFFQFS